MHVAMATNKRYLPGAIATINSIREYASPARQIEVHILESDIGEDDKKTILKFSQGIKIDFIHIDEREIAEVFEVGWNGSVISWARLWLPEYLPDIDVCIYTDVDTLWFADISELWDELLAMMKLGNKSIYWVRDVKSMRESVSQWHKAINPSFNSERYGNSGVIGMNLNKMRGDGFREKAVSFVRKHGIPPSPDQDVYNSLLHNDCGFLRGCWNALEMQRNYIKGCVLHVYSVGKYFPILEQGTFPVSIRPIYLVWFMYYWRIYKEYGMDVRKITFPIFAEIFFRIVGLFYVPRFVLRACFPLMSTRHVDSLSHFNFYSWFARKRKIALD